MIRRLQYTWRQKRLLAVDGATLMLPNHPTVTEEFGQHGLGTKADSKRSMVLASVLYDVLNLEAVREKSDLEDIIT